MNKQKLGNPVFLTALVLLLLNDFLWKRIFGNTITGKLSDFAGLFAFAYCFSCLLPSRAKMVHIATGLFFVIWKSPVVQPLIDGLNIIGIPLVRVVDYTDLWALLILPLSYRCYSKANSYQVRAIAWNTILAISFFAFSATSQIRHPEQHMVPVHKVYTFELPLKELAQRTNRETIKTVRSGILGNRLPLEFDAKSNSFLHRHSKDTIARLIDTRSLAATDTIPYNTNLVQAIITGNETRSELQLVMITADSPSDTTAKSNFIMDYFETKMIRKLRRPRLK